MILLKVKDQSGRRRERDRFRAGLGTNDSGGRGKIGRGKSLSLSPPSVLATGEMNIEVVVFDEEEAAPPPREAQFPRLLIISRWPEGGPAGGFVGARSL